MPYISIRSKQKIALFAVTAVLAAILNILPQMHHAGTTLYSFLVIAWGITVYYRILQTGIRRLLIAGAGLLLLMFILRLCRWTLFEWSQTADGLLWDALYIPLTGVPLMGLSAAVCVGKSDAERPMRGVQWLWPVWIVLCVLVLTNEIHGWLMTRNNGSDAAFHGWLYSVVVIWGVALALLTLAVLLRRCRISQARQLWYVPVGVSVLCGILLAVYYLNGGSPTIAGYKLYFVQEVYAALFILLWESCTQIGLIPSNTDYPALFKLSDLNAAILDNDGHVQYRADGCSDVPEREDQVVRRCRIRSGTVQWTEDLSSIKRLNREIAEATEAVEDENRLLEEENRVRAEKARYAERNRLYDEIDLTVSYELAELDKLTKAAGGEAGDDRKRLIRIMLLGVLVKRKTNLKLLSQENEQLSIWELYYAIRETFDYLSYAGVSCSVETPGDAKVPSGLLLLAYDLLTEAAGAEDPSCNACLVRFPKPAGFDMEIAVDTKPRERNMDRIRGEAAKFESRLVISEEDDTYYYRLTQESGVSV